MNAAAPVGRPRGGSVIYNFLEAVICPAVPRRGHEAGDPPRFSLLTNFKILA